MSLKNYVNGAFVTAWNGNVRPFHNPADNSQLGEVAESSVEDVDKAVRAAREAFDNGPWSRTPAPERAARLLKLADLIDARVAADLCRIQPRVDPRACNP